MISKVYYLRNSRGDYAVFDAYGWDHSDHFLFAKKFSGKNEAEDHKKLVNYTTPAPYNNYKIYSRKVEYK